MGFFGFKNKKDKKINQLQKEKTFLFHQNRRKDKLLNRIASDGLRHGSPEAGKYLRQKRK